MKTNRPGYYLTLLAGATLGLGVPAFAQEDTSETTTPTTVPETPDEIGLTEPEPAPDEAPPPPSFEDGTAPTLPDGETEEPTVEIPEGLPADVAEFLAMREVLREEFLAIVQGEYETGEARAAAIRTWQEANLSSLAALEDAEEALREARENVDRPDVIDLDEVVEAQMEAFEEAEEALQEELEEILEAEYASEEERAAAITAWEAANADRIAELDELRAELEAQVETALANRGSRPERAGPSQAVQDLRAQFAAAADELSRRNEELEAALEAGELAREERLARLEQDREARRQAAEEAREAARAEAEAEKDDTGDRRPGD